MDVGAVSGDVARLLQPLDADEAGLADRPTASASSTFVIRPFFCRWERMRMSMRSSFGARPVIGGSGVSVPSPAPA
jgi:hypothetical protein